MSKIVGMERISLKDNPEINEAAIQEYISEHPDSLGLGNLTVRERERVQVSGGRLDMLLADEDSDARYEVELQLGATDPSHIIRTIEYWDNERKKYPSYDHTAVIVAEDITSRFMNVISLFNGAIPLIAIQLSAYRIGDSIHISFTKIIDRVTREDDDDTSIEITDRSYWEKKSNKKQIRLVDELYERLLEYAPGIELKYKKLYIGVGKYGVSKNFVYFKPRKQYVTLIIKSKENNLDSLETGDLDIDYNSRGHKYRIRIRNIKEFDENKELFGELIQEARELYNLEE